MTPSPTADVARDAQITATRTLARTRWRVAAVLTLLMVGVYFGFILLVAYRPALLGGLVSDGLSLGIVLGVLVIVSAWVLTLIYVQWANRVYDPALAALRAMPGSETAARQPPGGAR
ncbi:DUF485 domain-containing protein [Gemmatimonas sp.]|uniref:DUF485 domain-containing protein n=1 Tax=Gemmatimonas sp. TaxID=1962908 RepID=UPI003569499C